MSLLYTYSLLLRCVTPPCAFFCRGGLQLTCFLANAELNLQQRPVDPEAANPLLAWNAQIALLLWSFAPWALLFSFRRRGCGAPLTPEISPGEALVFGAP